MLANHEPPFPSIYLDAMYNGLFEVLYILTSKSKLVSEFVHSMENWDPEII
jgi:hypothetical protein